jgi:hypothetical protein
MTYATAQVGDPFGTLPGVFTAKGAGAVVGTLSKINGPQGAAVASSVLQAIHDAGVARQSLGEALGMDRRRTSPVVGAGFNGRHPVEALKGSRSRRGAVRNCFAAPPDFPSSSAQANSASRCHQRLA